MCDASRAFLSSRAKLDDRIIVSQEGKQRVFRSLPLSTDKPYTCLREGDIVRFSGLPEYFLRQHPVAPRAIAIFKEMPGEHFSTDAFDFQNGEIVPMAEMPLGATFDVLKTVEDELGVEPPQTSAQPKPQLRPVPEEELVAV